MTWDRSWGTLVTAEDLLAAGDREDLVIFDCRFSLADTAKGETEYYAAHIPGARYAHLDTDLSGPVVTGITGRHPLPDPATVGKWIALNGVSSHSQVVVYDNMGGAIAARLWWILKWLGHANTAVLDGGIQAWVSAGGQVRSGQEPIPLPGNFNPSVQPDLVADADAVENRSQTCVLIDARMGERFRGENEPIDPVAGHIPGALSMPFKENLSEGSFIHPEALRRRYEEALANADSAICYCGSGVTAAHDILAIVTVGYPMPKLYVGSWSEWINEESRPVATSK